MKRIPALYLPLTLLAALCLTGTALADRVPSVQSQTGDDYNTVFAKTEVFLNGDREPGNRTEETNLGDLITDALIWGARKNGETVDASVINGGCIRASIAAGGISKRDIHSALAFGNTLSLVEITGIELLEVLEASTCRVPADAGGFPQVSGIEFTVNISNQFDAGDFYPGSSYHKPASIQRVAIQSVNGRDYDANAVYKIATHDFVAAGGDTYYAFSQSSANRNLGVPITEILTAYIQEELNGIISADYADPAGRITIIADDPFLYVSPSGAYEAANVPNGAVLYLARYEDERFQALEALENLSGTLPGSGKLFLLDESLRPLCAARELQL